MPFAPTIIVAISGDTTTASTTAICARPERTCFLIKAPSQLYVYGWLKRRRKTSKAEIREWVAIRHLNQWCAGDASKRSMCVHDIWRIIELDKDGQIINENIPPAKLKREGLVSKAEEFLKSIKSNQLD